MAKSIPRCVSCDEPRPGRFCAQCGEQRVGPRDRRLAHVVTHLIEATTNANGKAVLTLQTLLRSPGQLTADHVLGRRQPYLAPIQLFLLANLIFFLLQPLLGSNTLTTTLNRHLHDTWHSGLATPSVAHRLALRSLSLDSYATAFDASAVTQAKSLVLLLVPVFSLAVTALYWRHKRRFVDHLVFACHFGTFWLFLTCATLAATNLLIRLLRVAAIFPPDRLVGAATTATMLVVMTAYLYRAGRVAYDSPARCLSLVKATTLAVAFDLSLEGYRCALFFITFWST